MKGKFMTAKNKLEEYRAKNFVNRADEERRWNNPRWPDISNVQQESEGDATEQETRDGKHPRVNVVGRNWAGSRKHNGAMRDVQGKDF